MSLKVDLHQDAARAQHSFQSARCVKLQCSRLAESHSGVLLCLSATPLIFLRLSVLSETASNLICSIKRAGEGGTFSKERRHLHLISFLSEASLWKKKKNSVSVSPTFHAIFSTPHHSTPPPPPPQHYKRCSLTVLRGRDPGTRGGQRLQRRAESMWRWAERDKVQRLAAKRRNDGWMDGW